jgi:hypothetical protein
MPRGEKALAKLIVEGARQLGEPWLTYFATPELTDHLRELGFSYVAALTPEEASAHYFRNRRDSLRPPHFVGLIRASV